MTIRFSTTLRFGNTNHNDTFLIRRKNVHDESANDGKKQNNIRGNVFSNCCNEKFLNSSNPTNTAERRRASKMNFVDRDFILVKF